MAGSSAKTTHDRRQDPPRCSQQDGSSHKLSTLILDGIAWKDGYNGLPRGTAAFTLSTLAEKMGVSRQYLNVLLSELEASELKLEREKSNGKFAPWLFRFAAFDESEQTHDLVSDGGHTSLSREESNKTIFTGQINIDDCSNVFRTCWAELIKAAPSSNRQFRASDLCRVIGQAAYDARVLDAIRQFGCPRFTATLAVHGRAVLAGEITG